MGMKNKSMPNFCQHLLLMGDRFDAQVTQWFKGAVLIEHDLLRSFSDEKFSKLGRICSEAVGTKITKLTEVIGGTAKGITFAKISGSYPVVLSCNTTYERGLMTRLVEINDYLEVLENASSRYLQCLFHVSRYSRGLQKGNGAELRDIASSIREQHLFVHNSFSEIVEKNFRKLLV